MSRWLTLTIVFAAAAFVVAFRFSADGNDADAGQLNAARASVVEGDGPSAPRTAEAIRLAPVVELPKLAGEPAARVAAREQREAAERKARAARRKAAAARHKRAVARRKKAAAARRRAAEAAARRRVVTPRPRVVTPSAPRVVRPAPTPVYRAPAPPAPPAPQKKSTYVGKDFDSKG